MGKTWRSRFERLPGAFRSMPRLGRGPGGSVCRDRKLTSDGRCGLWDLRGLKRGAIQPARSEVADEMTRRDWRWFWDGMAVTGVHGEVCGDWSA
jgi:hypothetical protein